MLNNKLNKNNKDNSAFRNNLRALGFAQAINFLYPIFAIPIIGKYLGASWFGLLMSNYALAIILSTIVDYGFNFEGPRLVSRINNEKKRVTEIYFSIIFAKLSIAITLTTFVIAYVLFFRINNGPENNILLFTSIPIMLGGAISPQWLLHAIGNLSKFVYTNAIIRILCFTLYLTYDKNNPTSAALSLSMPPIFTSLISQIYISSRIHQIKWNTINLDIINVLKSATPAFISNIATLPYTQGGTLIVGYYHGPIAAGLYAASDRIIRPIISMQGIIFQSAYPTACASCNFSNIVKKTILLAYCIAIPSFVIFYYTPEYVLGIVYSKDYLSAEMTLKFISATLLMTPIAMAVAQLGLLARGHANKTYKCYLITSLIYFVLAPLLIIKYSHTGAGIALLIAEIISTFLLVLAVKK